MKNTTNIIRTAAVILTLIITTANFAQAGAPKANTASSSKQLNPNFDPNKKLVNVRTEPLINRDRQAGESFLNRNREPLINRKYVPKKYTKAQYYK
ncbi:MAG: hypothetical protein IPP60_07095 [Sphingobacteriales bacterium]|nr:hypothetical protein [Sphingobacteriales bacterium]